MSEKILDFIKHHCPASDIVGIMLTGSYANHTESRYSDVDIIVVSMLASRQTHENIIEDGTMYQLIIFPYCKIATLIFDDITSTRTVFFRMFKKGIILFDSKGLLKKLQNIFCGQEDSINSEIDILRLRRRITNEIEYILGSDETNKMHSALEVVRQTSQLIVGKQSLTGKHLDRAISLYKNEQSLLQNALSAYFINNNGKEFVNTIQALLKPFGGFLEKYTTGYVFNVPHDKQMLVFMPVCSMKSEATRNMIETIRKLCKPPFYYVVFYEGQNQMMEQGIYLFVYSETASITSFCRLLDKLRVPKGIYMSYPYQSSFYEGVYFGGMSTFRYLLPLFSRISTLYMDICQNKQAEHLIYQRTIAVKILYYYIYFSFKDAQRRKLLLLECVHFFARRCRH